MKKAILSAALALVMLLSIFPATAFAVELGENDKFYFGVTSADTTVSMKVDSVYPACRCQSKHRERDDHGCYAECGVFGCW